MDIRAMLADWLLGSRLDDLRKDMEERHRMALAETEDRVLEKLGEEVERVSDDLSDMQNDLSKFPDPDDIPDGAGIDDSISDLQRDLRELETQIAWVVDRTDGLEELIHEKLVTGTIAALDRRIRRVEQFALMFGTSAREANNGHRFQMMLKEIRSLAEESKDGE